MSEIDPDYMGGTMRLGETSTVLEAGDTLAREVYAGQDGAFPAKVDSCQG